MSSSAIRGVSARRVAGALVVGALAGIAANTTVGGTYGLELAIRYVAGPVGQIWLRSLIMVVIPLVFASLTLGVVGLSSTGKIGRVGLLALGYFLSVTLIAVVLGLVVVNGLRPGDGLSEPLKLRLLATYGGEARSAAQAATGAQFGIETLVAIVPRNPLQAMVEGDMLAVIVFALAFGAALLALPEERRRPVTAVLETINDAMTVIIGFVMRLAPIGVVCLVFGVTARFGLGIVRSLSVYVFTVVLGLGLHLFVVLPVLMRAFAGVGPVEFFRRTKMILATAFSTSSSSATLPTTLRVCQDELGLPREVCGFVIPLGATMNMNGTALFEGVTVLFLAQVFGVHLSVATQLVVIVMAVLTAVGSAGVPSGSIPLLILVLNTVGVPPEGIAIILGVDRFLDMCRTTLNVMGDVTATAVVARHTAGWRLPARGLPGGADLPGAAGAS